MQSFIALSLLLGLGHLLRMRIKLLQRLYMPSCVIAGIVGLAGLQLARGFDIEVSGEWTLGWSALPAFLINVVFACLFLGVKLPAFGTLWRRAGTQLAYGQIVAWGQYVVGIGLALAIFIPFWGLPAMFAGILPVGFEGGHGTAAGLRPTFETLGWPEGADLALASATGGIICAIVVGMVLVNWAIRRGYVRGRGVDIAQVPEDDAKGVIPIDRRPSAGRLTVSSDTIESLSLHIAIVGAAISIAYVLRMGLIGIESVWPYLAERRLLSSVPLFPLAMFGGMAIQFVEERYDRHQLIDIGLIRRIQNSALDYLVVAAIATINLQVLTAVLVPLLIIVAAGVGWNVFCVMVLAKRLLKDAWFERAIAEMGQSMGVTATGLLLLRVVDPDYETPAADAFACKQIMHEPFMGGGLWTSMAIPLLAVYGAWPVFVISSAFCTLWLLVLVIPGLCTRRAARVKAIQTGDGTGVPQ